MEHQTYWVTLVAVIPVLSLASGLEIRSAVGQIAESDYHGWRRRIALGYWGAQAAVTGFLLISVPQILDAIYDQEDPGGTGLISSALVFMTAMVAFAPWTTALDIIFDGDPTPPPRRPRSLERHARRLRRGRRAG